MICSVDGAEETVTGTERARFAVSEEVWKLWSAVPPGTAAPFCWRVSVTFSGKVTPEAGDMAPWKDTAYTPGVLIVKAALPAVWETSLP